MRIGLLLVAAGMAFAVQAGSLEQDAFKVYRKIGVGPTQTEPFTQLYEEFVRYRNGQMRRVLNSRTGEEVSVVAKKKARRAAKKSVKKMRAVLSEEQLVYYAEYLELDNQIYLRNNGLR